jgi:hypothetical protein
MADFDYDTKINTGASPITLSQSAGSNNDRDADGQALSRRSVRKSLYSDSNDPTMVSPGDDLSMSVAGMYQNMIKRIDELGWRLHDQIWHHDRTESGHLYSRRDTPLPSASQDEKRVPPVPKTVMRAYLRAQETGAATIKSNETSASNHDHAINDWYQEREKLKMTLPKLQRLLDHGVNQLSVDPNLGIYRSIDRAIVTIAQPASAADSPESVRAK